MAFVDDYSAWIICPSAEGNTRIIQNEVVPLQEVGTHQRSRVRRKEVILYPPHKIQRRSQEKHDGAAI